MGTFSRQYNNTSLLGRAVALVVGVGAFLVSLLVGAVFLAFVVGFMLLIGISIAIRVWWLRRKMANYEREHGDLEAEYTEVTVERRIKSSADKHRNRQG